MNIFLKLFLTFSKIGLFNFGGGYAMLSLIQNEAVEKNAWLSNAEFANIVAISQSTPGPIGINAATYVGYSSVINLGYSHSAAVAGAVLASLSVIWLPFILMLAVSRYLMTHKDSPVVRNIFRGLRPTIVGLIGAAALLLMSPDNFGTFSGNPWLFCLSLAIFALSFWLTGFRKANPVVVMLLCGILGLIFY